jgi:WD40 repeat protein
VRSGKWIGGAPFQSSTIALASRGRLLASAAALWDTEARKRVADLSAVASGATGIAFRPDGGMLVTGGPAHLMAFWDVNKRDIDGERLSGTRDAITHLLFSGDGESLAARSADGAVEMFDTKTREPKALIVPRDHLLGRTFVGHRRRQGEANWVNAVAFGSNGILASGADDGVLLWDIATGRPPTRLPQGAPVRSLGFSPDGTTLAVGTVAGTLKLWSVTPSKANEIGSMPEWDSARRRRFGSSSFYQNNVYSIAFSPDGRHVAAGDQGGSLLVWEVPTRTLVLRLDDPRPIVDVVFSPDGATLVWSTGTTIRVWDVRERRDRYQARAPTSDVQSMAMSHDGNTLAIGDRSGGIHLWDLAARRALRAQPLSGHRGNVTAVAFSRSGDRLVSSGSDGVRLWNVRTGNAIGAPLHGGEPETVSLAVSPDGTLAASGHRAGMLRVWDVDVNSWKALACRMGNRNLSDAEWQAYFPGEDYRVTCPDLPKPGAPAR